MLVPALGQHCRTAVDPFPSATLRPLYKLRCFLDFSGPFDVVARVHYSTRSAPSIPPETAFQLDCGEQGFLCVCRSATCTRMVV